MLKPSGCISWCVNGKTVSVLMVTICNGPYSFAQDSPHMDSLFKALIVAQPLMKFPTFNWTKRFITVLTRECPWSLSWARLVQSIPYHSISLRSSLLLSSHQCLGLPSGLFLTFNFPTKTLYAFLFFSTHITWDTQFTLLFFISFIIFHKSIIG